jgi:mannose-6-phosphate isomerase-like protein (cupin superfamily)
MGHRADRGKEAQMNANVARAAPFAREPGAGQTLNVLGVTHIYKATSAETAGAFSLWEAVIPPGAGAPPHTHSREDESFYILSGELHIESKASRRRFASGQAVSSSAGVVDAMPSTMSATGRHVSSC